MKSSCASCMGTNRVLNRVESQDARAEPPKGIHPTYVGRSGSGSIFEWWEVCPECGPAVTGKIELDKTPFRVKRRR